MPADAGAASAHAADAVLVEMHRDPARWFCSGFDDDGITRVFGHGDTKSEAEHVARAAADSYAVADIDWLFVSYAPEPLE